MYAYYVSAHAYVDSNVCEYVYGMYVHTVLVCMYKACVYLAQIHNSKLVHTRFASIMIHRYFYRYNILMFPRLSFLYKCYLSLSMLVLIDGCSKTCCCALVWQVALSAHHRVWWTALYRRNDLLFIPGSNNLTHIYSQPIWINRFFNDLSYVKYSNTAAL